MNPFAGRFNTQSWIWPVSGMCVVLGFMISLAWVTKDTRNSRISLLGPDQKDRITQAAVDIEAFQQLSQEVNKLRADKTELENAMSKRGEESTILNKSLQELKVYAGMTKVVGPGVVITLRDSARAESDLLANGGQILPESAVHDGDVLKVVNELFSAGAEAISVNNHRVATTSSIRCVGPTILINDMKIATPVVIRAIGDPETMYGGLTLPGGVLTEIRQTDPAMVHIEKVKKQELPAFVGKSSNQYATVPEEPDSEQAVDKKT